MIRLIDLLLSIFFIFILSPFFILISIILKFSGEGEILYFQDRVGKNGSLFPMVKFATMRKDSFQMGTGSITLKNDFRVLPFGAFLRKSKLNELPQLFNILWGHMSFIGPRPMTMETFSFYTLEVRNEIVKVRPGLSGIGSIVFRNEESFLNNADDSIDFYRNDIARYKGMLESWFIKNASPLLYIKLFLISIYVVLFPTTNYIFLWKIFPTLPESEATLKQLLK